MRIPNGILKNLSETTGLNRSYLSNIVSTRFRVSRDQAIKLEKGCKKLGLNVPKELWVFGSSEDIKRALVYNKYNKTK